MKIRMKADAKQAYINRAFPVNWEYAAMIEKINGKVIEVETDFLFRDQFNTPPIEGVTELGLRIMVSEIDEVIDDIRPSKIRCDWCGHISDASDGFLDICFHCGRSDYVKRFDEMMLWNGRRNV